VTAELRCAGCGWATAGVAFRCPYAGHGGDHVLQPATGARTWPSSDDPNPFVRYRSLLHAYTAGGATDAAWCERVERLDARVAAVDGHGFRVTPVRTAGELVVKDETGNVARSHKARHLFGALLALPDGDDRELAVASCGNAALAAAVVARAASRRLRVFVPTWAPADVLARLRELGAEVEVCQRPPGGRGDPTLACFRAAVTAGAVPFSCQGTDNALALDGGRTLGWELADQITPPDHVVVQVGGGALASSTFHALADAVALGRWPSLPRLHAVQAVGAAPLVRAWEALRAVAAVDGWEGALAAAAADPSRFMRPWDGEPTSAATGILDDETYDWLAIVRAVAATGGSVVAVDEPTIAAAVREGRTWVPDVGPTGTAGLAGVRALQGAGGIREGERVAVVFSGVT